MGKHHGPLQIRLTEPVIYLKGPSTGADFRGRPQEAREGQGAIVRGLLTLRLNKATRIRDIYVELEGRARTEWPEGIGNRRTDTYEEHKVIEEKTVFFSGKEEAKAQTIRRSQSVGPGVWQQHDMSTDDLRSLGLPANGDWAELDRPLPRSLSVLPAHPQDWHDWYRDGMSRRASPVGSAAASRVNSTADLASLRTATNALNLEDERGPTPAYTPHNNTPPISSHPSSILLGGGGAGSRGRSPMPRHPVGRRASDRDEGDEWKPATPTGEPQDPLNFPNGDAAPNVRFQDRPAEQGESEPHVAPELRLRRTASSRTDDETTEDGETHEGTVEDEYHPVRDVTLACPTAATTPIMSPIGTPSASRRTSMHLDQTPPPESPLMLPARPSSNLRHMANHEPSQSSMRTTESSTPSEDDTRGRRGPRSESIDDSSRNSESTSRDDYGRGGQSSDRNSLHHHKFSLAAALRSLSKHGRSRSRSTRPESRAQSRAQSRTRSGAETPRTPHFDLVESAPMSRVNSAQSRSRSRAPSPTGRGGRSESRGRPRNKLFGKAAEDPEDEVHNWKEFRKGVYNYPIAFHIPTNSPPTVRAEFGSVIYRLKATVVRVGALTPNFYEEKEVTMIAGPQEDDMEETENVIVERQWEDQMRYQIALSGKAFPIGGIIPISIRLMPLAKCKIYRLVIVLEEKTDYYAAERKVARHETPRRFVLFAAKGEQVHKKERSEPLLPILSDAMDAAKNSPLAPLAREAALNNPREFSDYSHPEDDVYASLLDPMGPWHLEKDLVIPDCTSRIKFTTKHDSTNIAVSHWLKVTVRVERGDDNALDSKGRRKQFDIIIETPIKILDCRVNVQYNSLPSYDHIGNEQYALGTGCSLHSQMSTVKHRNSHVGASMFGGSPMLHSGGPGTPGAPTPHSGSEPGTGTQTPALSLPPPAHTSHGSHAPGNPEHDDSLLERNIVYDRLVSGQEAETGEEPPTYKEAVANAIRSARSMSRGGSPMSSRNQSLAPSAVPSRSGSRAPSRAPSRSRGPSRNTSRAQLYIEE